MKQVVQASRLASIASKSLRAAHTRRFLGQCHAADGHGLAALDFVSLPLRQRLRCIELRWHRLLASMLQPR